MTFPAFPHGANGPKQAGGRRRTVAGRRFRAAVLALLLFAIAAPASAQTTLHSQSWNAAQIDALPDGLAPGQIRKYSTYTYDSVEGVVGWTNNGAARKPFDLPVLSAGSIDPANAPHGIRIRSTWVVRTDQALPSGNVDADPIFGVALGSKLVGFNPSERTSVSWFDLEVSSTLGQELGAISRLSPPSTSAVIAAGEFWRVETEHVVLPNGQVIASGRVYNDDTGTLLGTIAPFRHTSTLDYSDAITLSGLSHGGDATGYHIKSIDLQIEAVLGITGTVFEDIDGGLLAGGAPGGAGHPGIGNATVRLYDSAGSPFITTTTAADGSYSLTAFNDADVYYVAVDAPVSGSALSEQTYASAGIGNLGPGGGAGYGSLCVAPEPGYGDQPPATTSNTAENPPNGACYGGRRGAVADNGASGVLDNAEHVVRVAVDATDVAAADFGFSFNVVTNVEASGQGTVAQFVANANAITGANSMHFVPAVLPNAAAGGSAWWRNSAAALLTLTDADTTLDGRAYSNVNGADDLDLINPAQLGSGGMAGVDGLTLPQLDGPELQLDAAMAIQGDRAEIRRLAVNTSIDIMANEAHVEGNLINVSPASYADAGGSGYIALEAGMSDIDIAGNLFFKANGESSPAIFTRGGFVTDVEIRRNEIRHETGSGNSVDAIRLANADGGLRGASLIEGNLIEEWPGAGFYDDSTAGTRSEGVLIRNNTITGAQGSGGTRDAIYVNVNTTGDASRYRVVRNVLKDNGQGGTDGTAAAGVALGTNAKGILISRNLFGGNAGNAIDLGNDGVSRNSSLCGARGTGTSNADLGRPTIRYISDDGAMLHLEVHFCKLGLGAPAGPYAVELYAVDVGHGDGSGFGILADEDLAAGEGVTFLTSITGLTVGTEISGVIEVSIPRSSVTSGHLGAINFNESTGDTSEFSVTRLVDSAPTLTVGKISLGGVDEFELFAEIGSEVARLGNGFDFDLLETTAPESEVVGRKWLLGAPDAQMAILEYVVDSDWQMISAVCTDRNAAATGNPAGPSIGVIEPHPSYAAGKLRIPPENVRLNADLHCTFTNAIMPTLTVSKISVDGTETFEFAGTTENGNGFGTDSIATTAADTETSGAQKTLTAIDTLTEIEETLPAGWSLTSAECTDANAATTGNPGDASIGTIVNGNTLQIAAEHARAGADLQCVFTNTFADPVLSGQVILDDGTDAGVAHNAVQDGGERGRAGVKVSLTDCTGTVHASATTGADGAFSLSLGDVPPGSVCLVKTQSTDFAAVSADVGDTAGSYTRATDSLAFTLAANTNYSGVVLGEVGKSLLTTDNIRTIPAGNSVTYAHRYSAGTSAAVTFETAEAPIPAEPNWTSVLYIDANCDARLNTDDGDALLVNPVPVTVADTICLLNKVASPSGTGYGAKNVTTVTASEDLTPAPAPTAETVVFTHVRTDTTTVGSSSLLLLKEVRVLATCPADAAGSLAEAEPFVTSNAAEPGAAIEYRILYRNEAAEPVTQVRIADSVPLHTQFAAAYCVEMPASGIDACTVSTAPAVGADSGSILWDLVDATTSPTTGLQPGGEGSVGFCVELEQ